MFVITIFDSGQAINWATDHERCIGYQGKIKNGVVFLGEGEGAVKVLDQCFKIAFCWRKRTAWSARIFAGSAIAVHTEHMAALAEKKHIVRVGPAIPQNSIHHGPGGISIKTVIGQIKINCCAGTASNGDDIVSFPKIALSTAQGTATRKVCVRSQGYFTVTGARFSPTNVPGLSRTCRDNHEEGYEQQNQESTPFVLNPVLAVPMTFFAPDHPQCT